MPSVKATSTSLPDGFMSVTSVWLNVLLGNLDRSFIAGFQAAAKVRAFRACVRYFSLALSALRMRHSTSLQVWSERKIAMLGK